MRKRRDFIVEIIKGRFSEMQCEALDISNDNTENASAFL